MKKSILLFNFFLVFTLSSNSQNTQSATRPDSFLLKTFDRAAIQNLGKEIIELPNPRGPH